MPTTLRDRPSCGLVTGHDQIVLPVAAASAALSVIAGVQPGLGYLPAAAAARPPVPPGRLVLPDVAGCCPPCHCLEDEAAEPVLPYRLGMPGAKRPTSQDAATARLVLLDGLIRDAGILDIAGELAPLHPRNDTFPGEVFLGLAADALALEGIRERFLAECTFRGSQITK